MIHQQRSGDAAQLRVGRTSNHARPQRHTSRLSPHFSSFTAPVFRFFRYRHGCGRQPERAFIQPFRAISGPIPGRLSTRQARNPVRSQPGELSTGHGTIRRQTDVLRQSPLQTRSRGASVFHRGVLLLFQTQGWPRSHTSAFPVWQSRGFPQPVS